MVNLVSEAFIERLQVTKGCNENATKVVQRKSSFWKVFHSCGLHSPFGVAFFLLNRCPLIFKRYLEWWTCLQRHPLGQKVPKSDVTEIATKVHRLRRVQPDSDRRARGHALGTRVGVVVASARGGEGHQHPKAKHRSHVRPLPGGTRRRPPP